MKNIILSFFLTLLPLYVSADAVEIDGIWYNLIPKGMVAEITSMPSGKYSGNIVIPETITYDNKKYSVAIIGKNAFNGCSDMISVTIPNSVTTIDIWAFDGCSGMTSINIPNSVLTIGYGAFRGCRSLVNISIPNSVTSIDGAFEECTSLTSVNIPSSVTSIGGSTFQNCIGLTTITIPSSVNSIGINAFYGCSGLTTIIIPNSVTSIDRYAFANCFNLKSITIPSSITYIGIGVFQGCRSLGSATIPHTVTSIADNLFYECSALASVTIPNGIISIGNHAFYNCSSLTSIDIPNSVTSIGYCAFAYSSLSSVTIPNSVTSIGWDGFGWINTLTTVSIGSGTSFIDSEAFAHCANLSEVYCHAEQVPNTNMSAFSDSYIEYATLYVPASSINRYQSSAPWNGFKEIVEMDVTQTVYTLSITTTGNGSASYDGITIRNRTQTFTVEEGSEVVVYLSPDTGYQVVKAEINGIGPTEDVAGITKVNISSMEDDNTIEIEFDMIPVYTLTDNEVNYNVVSNENRTVKVSKGNYGPVLRVPATLVIDEVTWQVVGIDQDALTNASDLAAILWQPEVTFSANISNPNLLLYVKSADYAPYTVKNVIVDGVANNITLTDASNGNNFYCPQEFIAQNISYTHNYSMTSGLKESRGWETIALPYDVQKVAHQSKGEIVSFANWKSGDSRKPFWLMQMSSSGWTMADNIRANTPYIISMPNNPEYKSGFLLNGNVTFSAENVTVHNTDNIHPAVFEEKTFVPNFAIKVSEEVLALNVINDLEQNNEDAIEGSTFVKNRPVHPFQAYMTTTQTTRTIPIADGMTTGFSVLILDDNNPEDWYDLQGRHIKQPSKGVYIRNGVKQIIR